MNREFPVVMTLTAPAGVTVEKSRQSARDAIRFDDNGAEFDVAFTAAAPGKKVFTGELRFAVCSTTLCDPKKEELSFVVDVQ